MANSMERLMKEKHEQREIRVERLMRSLSNAVRKVHQIQKLIDEEGV